MASWVRSLRLFMRRMGADRRGAIALKFAFFASGGILLTVGSIELMSVHTAQVRMQDIADAAALAGANDLGLAIDDGVAIERAHAFVEAHVSEWVDPPAIASDVKVVEEDGQRVIDVRLNGTRISFFANMLPPGGWKFRAEAKATTVGLTPLCVLVSGDTEPRMLNVRDRGRLQAQSCLVHSNRDILVEGGEIRAAMVRAVTTAGGSIYPQAGTGAAEIEDPLAGLNLNAPSACADEPSLNLATGSHVLSSGVHCGLVKVSGDAQLILSPGEHYFGRGKLEVSENASMTGSDVVLVFDQTAHFDFKDHAVVNLDGRRSGALAGMVLIANRDNRRDFTITSDNVERLLGVIYVPRGQLIIEGAADVARDSAWTVIVARLVQLRGSPSVVINANYQSSSVPVPEGVGPRTGGSRLIN